MIEDVKPDYELLKEAGILSDSVIFRILVKVEIDQDILQLY